MSKLDGKRIFTIVSPLEDRRKVLSEFINSHLANVQVFMAADGSEALYKIQNLPPHMVVMDWELSRLNGLQLLTAIVGDNRLKETCIIVCGNYPENEMFVDEIVTSRIQFVEKFDNEYVLVHAVNKALNAMAQKEETEFHLKFMAAGDTLIHQGERGDFVYLVKRGTLRVIHIEGDQEVELGIVGPGEFVGEMAYINGEVRSADVRVESDCELIEIPVGYLDQVLFTKPAWAKALMTTLSKRLKVVNGMLVDKNVAS